MKETAKLKKKRRTAGQGDLVSIAANRLNAAWGVLTPNVTLGQMANRLKESRAQATGQLLGMLRRGTQPTCRERVRDALASHFGAPITSAWLGGDGELLWSTGPRYAGVEDPASFWEQFDLAQRPAPDSHWRTLFDEARVFLNLPPEDRLPVPPAYQIRAWRLSSDLEAAWHQQQTKRGRISTKWPNTVAVRSEDEVLERSQLGCAPVVWTVLSLPFWRRHLYDDSVGGIILPEESDRFAEHMEDALRTLLRPWFDGEIRVDEEWLNRLGDIVIAASRAARMKAMERVNVRGVDPVGGDRDHKRAGE